MSLEYVIDAEQEEDYERKGTYIMFLEPIYIMFLEK